MTRTRFNLLYRMLLLGLLGVLAACSPVVAVPPDTPTPGSTDDSGGDPVLTWERVGGIAGFCDAVAIYAGGRVVVTTCEGDPVAEGTLSQERQTQLARWLGQFAGFAWEQRDPATADAMTVGVTFAGTGSAAASDDDRQAIADFAASVFAGIAMNTGDAAATPTPLSGVMPAPDEGRAYDAARDALAAELDVELASMEQIAMIEEVWRDACLGLPGPDEMCATVMTPGFRIVIGINGTEYGVRTNRDGSVVRVEGQGHGEVSQGACLTDFAAHQLAASDDPERMTLAPYELDQVLALMGLMRVCIPQAWGAPFLNVDWNEADLPGATGRMVSLGFENRYEGAGWSDLYVLYSTYDFQAGTEYDTFATREDWEAVQQGTMENTLPLQATTAFVRFHRGLCYGPCSVFRTIVVPFESYYVAVVQRVGEIEGDQDWDVLTEELRAGEYPEGWQVPTPALDSFVRGLAFIPGQTRVDWDEAVALIKEGRVAEVFQTHALQVELVLKDGSRLTTFEPGIDDVFDVIKACGDTCKNMVLATE